MDWPKKSRFLKSSFHLVVFAAAALSLLALLKSKPSFFDSPNRHPKHPYIPYD